MSWFRIIAGQGAAGSYAILSLSLRLAEAAKEAGLAVASNKASHAPASSSRYLLVRDRQGHRWQVRVSNHRRPLNSPHAVPHLDLVSLDGTSGFEEAVAVLVRIAAGEITWANTGAAEVRRAARQQRQGYRP